MSKTVALAVYAAFMFAPVLASDHINAMQPGTCFLVVTELWPKATHDNPSQMAQARNRAFNKLGALIAAAYKNGGYANNPTSFPVHHTDFRDDHIIIDFRVSCPSARLYLVELLQAYSKRLSAKEKATGPDLIVRDKPATEYDDRCGLGSTAATCE